MKNFRKVVDFHKSNSVLKVRKLKFLDIPKNFDVYNPSSVFEFDGDEYLFGRVESRKKWADSKVYLFKKVGDYLWRKEKTFSPLNLEDPFVKKIEDFFVFGGVQVKRHLLSERVDFKTVFYRGKDPFSLKKFAEGPWGMKDIRLSSMKSGKIALFTRPMGGKYGRGKVGFNVLDSLDDLDENSIKNSEIIRLPFLKDEWGGVNDVVSLENGLLGVLGHLAYSSDNERNKFYFPICFKFNTSTRKISKIELILDRSDLPFDLPKNRFLYNVIFPGGINLNKDYAKIYVGVGDSTSYEITIKNPFNSPS
jgi:hypothetical protein